MVVLGLFPKTLRGMTGTRAGGHGGSGGWVSLWRALLGHELFNLVRLDGDAGHEIGVAGFSDEVVVFQTDA